MGKSGQSSPTFTITVASSMNRRPFTFIRPLLAFLTVLASFVFQLRVDAIGGLTPAPLSVSELQAALAQGTLCGAEKPSAPVQSHHTRHSRHSSGGAGSDPHDGHKAHCPFCVTNAFALEVGVTGLPQGPPDFLPQPDFSASFRLVAHVRHADARAPPFVL